MNQVLVWTEKGTSSSPLFLYLSFFSFLLFFVVKFRPGASKYKFPPSPSKLPFIGNLHQVLHGSPHHAFRSLAQKHGPLMLLHLGRVPTLVVSSADMARDVLKTYDHVFSGRPELMIPKRLFYGKDMAFSPYGEYWRQVRKVCVLQLLCPKKVESFGFVREEEVALMIEKIKQSTLTVNLSQILVSYTNNVASRVALRRKYDQDEDGGKLREILKEFISLLGVYNMGDLIPSLGWLNHLNGLYTRVDKNFREIDSFLDDVIEEHLVPKRRIDDCENEEEDFVDVLLGIEKDSSLGIPMGRDNTKAMIMDMFAAGTDTSYVVLVWTMSELLRHPEILQEVQKEVRDVARGKPILKENDIEEMLYLKSVIKETLRLHPPLPLLVLHESTDKVKLHGYEIPAKTTVMINALAIGRDPMWWDEPDQFLPKRFLNGSSASVDFKGQDFQFIPFGAGRRGCPGIGFATATMGLALANLLNTFDWALPNGLDGRDLDMQERLGITVHRKNELLLTAKMHYS